MGFIALIIVLIAWWHLGAKINFLEKRIDDLSLTKPNKPVDSPDYAQVERNHQDTQSNQVSPIPRPVSSYGPQSVTSVNTYEKSNGFIDWIKEDFLVKVGGLLVLLAIGWFVSFAFANNWIGPFGRIALGLILGASVLAFGVFRMNTFVKQGAIFTVIGSSTIIMTIYAARELYDFFTPATALGLMFLTVVFMAFISVRSNLESLAYVTLILGSVSPLFTNSPSPDAVGLFTYLLVVTGGTLWVVWQTGWTKLTLISLAVTFFYSMNFLYFDVDDKSTVMLFTFVFVGIYFLANIVSLVRRREEEMNHLLTHVSTAIGTAIFLVFWVEATSVPEWKSLLYSTWAFVFCLGTYIVYLYTANKVAFYLYGAVGLGLIGVATARELSGPALTIAFFLEIGLLIMAGCYLKASAQTIKLLSALLLIPGLLSLGSFASRAWRDGFLHSDFVVLLLALLVFSIIGVLVQGSTVDEVGETRQVTTSKVLLSIAGAYGVSLIWLVTHSIMADDVATTLSLIIYTVFGLVFYALGRNQSHAYLKDIGLVLIGGVVLRLIFFDVWDMETGGRIVTFLTVGVLLISTAFIRKADSNQIENN